MISPCITQPHLSETNGVTRVVKIFDDPYAGLKGHDYITARNLNQPVKRVQTSAHANGMLRHEVCK